MHVGGVEVVLLVPGRGRQHDVGVDAGRRHAEVEGDQQVELSFRRFVVPDDLAWLLRAHLAELLALHAVRRAEQVLEEILVALAGRAEQVGAPHEHVARPVLRVVRVVAGQLQLAGLQRARRRSPSASLPGGRGLLGDRRADWFRAAAPTAASPCARRARCSRSASPSHGPAGAVGETISPISSVS